MPWFSAVDTSIKILKMAHEVASVGFLIFVPLASPQALRPLKLQQSFAGQHPGSLHALPPTSPVLGQPACVMPQRKSPGSPGRTSVDRGPLARVDACRDFSSPIEPLERLFRLEETPEPRIFWRPLP
ncbi:hypothetical protein M440DRAFT_156808 [Trichoderma longibrachiatum ATCC 18648]|uniref:Uncharacterized protein n=1 Tax=Trichoderma longibrachiatum ATCC 18648 TaxID=983965 RepID=A0A2T4BSZ6_TRILO|nr:hypothetical protein M440DRAFT_156808 [Trichoderma longibrachiatum ATCC 18648]